MKRYAHAWIAIRAMDRLGFIAQKIKEEEEKPGHELWAKAANEQDENLRQEYEREAERIFEKAWEKYAPLEYFSTVLKDKIDLVVEGSWIPDNIIGIFYGGHEWKYERPLLDGEEWEYGGQENPYKGYKVTSVDPPKYYRQDHADTLSLSYQEATHVGYTFNRPWRKVKGRLVDRCVAVEQMMRDMILYQRDEMHSIAATLMVKFKNELFTEPEKVRTFLCSIKSVKDFYDEEDEDEKYVNRAAIIDIRNNIDDKEYKWTVRTCLNLYGDNIKKYIKDSNSVQSLQDDDIFFPMFFTDEQIALIFFTLSHYVSDAHMPLHCDNRQFGNPAKDVHGKVEKEWEKWIMLVRQSTELGRSLSESARAEKFLNLVFPEGEYEWDKFHYRSNSILDSFDEECGNTFWVDRPPCPLGSDLWEELVGVTYASWCLSTRLLEFSDNRRVAPMGQVDRYSQNFDRNNVTLIEGSQWWGKTDLGGLPGGIGIDYGDDGNVVRDLRSGIWQFVNNYSDKYVGFKYLSLMVLVDAVECVANIWARTIMKHMEIAYSKKTP